MLGKLEPKIIQLLRPWPFVFVLSVLYMALTLGILNKTLHNPARVVSFTEKDSAHYLAIARTFADGDFSMSYVKERPHRQPLYPLLLAPAVKLGGGALFPLGLVNIFLGLLTLLFLYFGSLKLFENRLVAACAAVSLLVNSFLIKEIGSRLMTEPLHIFLMLLILFFFVLYVRERRSAWLLFASGITALDYLARPNGLFVIGALLATLLPYDLWLLARGRDAGAGTWPSLPGKFARLATKYLCAVFIFVLLSVPSWVPRMQIFGNPIDHGYLSNYMYLDTYNEAHTGNSEHPYTWRDYAAIHSKRDFFNRWAYGFRKVWFAIPFKYSPLLHLLALAGVCLALGKRNSAFGLLALFAFVQSLPLVWTYLSNQNPRIAYAAILPFEWIFSALALLWIAQRFPLTARSSASRTNSIPRE